MIEAVDLLKLAGGIVYLILGGDLLVRGAIALARRRRISPAVIGVSIIALGTSAPEFIVAILAATSGHGAIAIGNVVGSNIANILPVLGVAALFYPMQSGTSSDAVHAGFMLAFSIVFVGLCTLGDLDRVDGVFLLLILAVCLLSTLWGNISILNVEEDDTEDARILGLPNTPAFIWLFIGLGCVILPLGADLTVRSASRLALDAGVGEVVVSASIVAFGTSLPELIATLFAALHRQVGMAMGNVVGSNVLNILAVMGVTSVITDVVVPRSLLAFDLWFMLGCAVLLWVLLLRRVAIGRSLGVAFIGAYVAYLWIIY